VGGQYKGKFNDGWDAYRERVFKRQLEIGRHPEGHDADPARRQHAGLGDVPEGQRAFQRRLMEVFAGFVEPPTCRSAAWSRASSSADCETTR